MRVLEHTPHVQAGWLTTLDLEPRTGRRHQLRLHCAALGHVICGDDLYAAEAGRNGGFIGKRSSGLFLQSLRVSVPHPDGNGRWVRAEAAEAPKFRRQRERARLGWMHQQRRAATTDARAATPAVIDGACISRSGEATMSVDADGAPSGHSTAAAPLSRRLAATLLAISATCSASLSATLTGGNGWKVPPAEAAIPSFSEYDAVQYRSRAVPPPPPSEPPTLSEAEGVAAVVAELDRIGSLVERGGLEEVRAALRQPLFAAFLGYTPGVRGNAANIKPAAALMAACSSSAEGRSALRELLLDLKRLDDFCLTNRVIVFNAEDLEQVKALMERPAQPPEDRFDVDEARTLVTDARGHAAVVQAALRPPPAAG